MEPTSAAQLAAYEQRVAADIEQPREDMWVVGLDMRSPTPPFTSLMSIMRDRDGGLHLLDVGLATDATWDRVLATLHELGAELSDVRSIIATHHHNEHIDLAGRLRDASGAQLVMSRAEHDDIAARPSDRAARLAEESAAWEVPDDDFLATAIAQRVSYLDRPLPDADLLVDDGELLPIPGFRLEVVATPGHTPGSMCLLDRERDVILTGDHILPNQVPGFGLGVGLDDRNPLEDFLASLRRLDDGPEVLPSHGWRFRGLASRARQIGERHLNRSREVAALLAADNRLPVWQLASRLSWSGGWDALTGFTRMNALRQTAVHRDYVLGGGSLDY